MRLTCHQSRPQKASDGKVVLIYIGLPPPDWLFSFNDDCPFTGLSPATKVNPAPGPRAVSTPTGLLANGCIGSAFSPCAGNGIWSNVEEIFKLLLVPPQLRVQPRFHSMYYVTRSHFGPEGPPVSGEQPISIIFQMQYIMRLRMIFISE